MKRLAYIAGALMVLTVLLVALAPLLVDAPAARAEIQRRLSDALHGQVGWASLEIAFFPVPHGELREVRVEMPGKLSAAADRVDVHLRLWPLLLGRAEVSSVSVLRPRLRITPGEANDQPFDHRAALGGAAKALREYAPDMELRVEHAAVELSDGFALREVNARGRAGDKGVDLELDAASDWWKRVAAKGRLEYADLSARATAELTDFELARIEVPEVVLEGKLSLRASASLDKTWQLQLEVTKTDAALKLAGLPWTIAPRAAKVTVTADRIVAAGVEGTMDKSTFSALAVQLQGKQIVSASGRATLPLEQWLPWLKEKLPLEEIVSATGSADVHLQRLALAFERPAHADYEAIVTPRKVSAVVKMLPAPLAVDGGTIRAAPKEIRLDNVGAAMLDARTRVSGRLGKTVELSLADGVAGEKLLRWALEKGGLPPRLQPSTPLRFAAQRIAWAPKGALEADARFDFEGGPALGVALAWRPELLELRRVTLKDAHSDAAFSATIAGELIQASFSGLLAGQSIPAMLREKPPAGSGTAQGELRLTIDRRSPERTLAEGKLRIAALDLTWLAGRKAVIERAEIVSERSGTRVSNARFGWQDQYFELNGEGRRTEQGPVIEARLESAGVDLERLLPPPDPKAKRKPSAIWPLPLAGRIELRAGFVQHKRYRIEPFEGVLALEPQRARLEVKEARMCGVSFPMEIEARPDHNSAAAHVVMADEPLERTVRCLTGGDVELTGAAHLKAELRVEGRRPHLVRNLTGTVEAEVRDGRVKKFALLGNVLAFRGLASVEDMKQDGFPYRRMSAKGRFADGQFRLEEGFFDSNAARLAATGHVDLLGASSRLTVLLAPLTSVERMVGVIPLLGDVFGGTMVALPVEVTGDIRNPYVVPLGPRAITDQLLGIFERTLKLPGKLMVPEQPRP